MKLRKLTPAARGPLVVLLGFLAAVAGSLLLFGLGWCLLASGAALVAFGLWADLE